MVGLTALLVTLAFASPAHAVTYGDPVLDGSKFPEVVVVHIYSDSSGEYVPACSGTLISQTEVLTAAHCVRGYENFQVEVGATEIGNGRIIAVRDSWYSSRYSDQKFANDVGLLLLASPANVAAVAKMAPSSFSPTSKTSYTIVGFGDDQNGDQGPLRAAGLSVQTSAAARYFGRVFNAKTTLAAGRYRKSERVYAGACSGDSGGPLFTKIKGKRYIVGITNYGATSCEASKPSVFARVGYYGKEIAKGRAILATVAATPLQNLSLSLTSTARSYYNAFTVVASTDPSLSLLAICVKVNGVAPGYGDVYGDGTYVGFSPSSGGCLSLSGSAVSAGRLDFDTDVPLGKVVVTLYDELGRSASKDFGIEAAATPLTLSVTPTTSTYNWERRYTVTVANSALLLPLKLCVTVDGSSATSSQVLGDISKIPYTPTAGCFTSSSSYAISGGYLSLQKSAILGSHVIGVSVTDGLGRSQSTTFSFTGCSYPYSC